MATGYTHILLENPNITLKEFVLRCARAFGACIMQREDPLDRPPEMEKVESYHEDRLLKAKEALTNWQLKSDNQLHDEFVAYKIECIKSAQETVDHRARNRALYESMLRQVEKWNPPSADHVELKNFMIKQIEESIKFDCGMDSAEEYIVHAKALDFDEWKAMQLKMYQRDVEYHAEQHAKEVEIVESRNRWKQQLYDSLT